MFELDSTLNYHLRGIVWIVSYLFLTQRKPLKMGIRAMVNRKKASAVSNSSLLEEIYRLTGYKITRMFVVPDTLAMGFVRAFPRPTIIYSNSIVNNLSEEELLWVTIHEVGHIKQGHVFKLMVMWALFLMIGIMFIFSTTHLTDLLYLFPLTLLVCSLLFLRFARRMERKADEYALNRIPNPTVVASALNKFAQLNKYKTKTSKFKSWFETHDSITKRIAYAERYNPKN